MRCTSMFASSSHMERISKLGSDLQDLGQSLVWKSMIEGLVYVF